MAALVEAAVVTLELAKNAPPGLRVQDWHPPETVDRLPTKVSHPRGSGDSVERAPQKVPTQDVQSAMHVRRP
jgi:hypothetical protein